MYNFRWISVVIVLPALAGLVAGCADSHLASSNASVQPASDTGLAQRPRSVQVGYGMSSDGPTTDLYTEVFRAKARDEVAAPATVAQGQPVTGVPTRGRLATGAPGVVSQNQPAVSQSQPAIAPNAGPAAPPTEAATATAFGISSSGPTTDLYTELFGGRGRE